MVELPIWRRQVSHAKMQYKTYYEIAADPFAGIWQMLSMQPTFWFLFIVITLPFLVCACLTWTRVEENFLRKKGLSKPTLTHKILGSVISLLMAAIPMFGFITQYQINRKIQADYQHGKLKVLEGSVTDFVFGRAYKGPSSIQFKIDKTFVKYCNGSPGFALTTANLFHNGERVRIWVKQYDPKADGPFWPPNDTVAIARLDVADNDNHPQPKTESPDPATHNAAPHKSGTHKPASHKPASHKPASHKPAPHKPAKTIHITKGGVH